ncbi:MAG TPA: SDR family oxidoreductase [Flavobacteriales bacterium]|nr:SDR family oxidoreductase [Flavobacteriales bacterium]
MNLNLTGKRALVCGASQGIGLAVAREFADLGAGVTMLARSATSLEAAMKSLRTPAGQKHSMLLADMADTEALRTALASLDHPIDIVVHNTGGPPPGLAHEAETAAFESAFRLHLIAYQTIVRAVVPGMKERKEGRIINVISTSVKQPLPNLGVSNTIRGAVAQWSKTLANELGPFGITVNNVLPGATSTERLTAIIKNKSAKSGVTEAEATDEMLHEIPLRRFAKPEELAYAVAFLAGPSGAYINGINLPVDGGRTGAL